jgi:hypothetical protein
MSLCLAPASRQSRHVVGGDEMHAVDDKHRCVSAPNGRLLGRQERACPSAEYVAEFRARALKLTELSANGVPSMIWEPSRVCMPPTARQAVEREHEMLPKVQFLPPREG